MEYLQEVLEQVANMTWFDYLDIIIVAFLIYEGLKLIRTTATMRIVRAIFVILAITWGVAMLELNTLSFLLEQVLAVGLMALVVLFQPELRRIPDQLGSTNLKRLLSPEKQLEQMDIIISQTAQACEVMSREKVGALIVFARKQRLDEYFKTGTVINGRVSEQLIRNIFFPKAALHDGAMIIRDGQIAAAGFVLPLSESSRLHADLGTRHRAGVGASEASDAVVVIVSEETGTISVAVGGMLKRHLAPQTLERLLRQELIPQEKPDEKTGIIDRFRQWNRGKEVHGDETK